MTEFKTLKELQIEFEWPLDTYVGLREAAIKLIKRALETNSTSLKRLEYPLMHINVGTGAVQENKFDDTLLFAEFFNITEEDLKEND